MSMIFKDVLKRFIELGGGMKSDEEREKCEHKKWAEETKENGWRSFCLECGQPARGSCQG